MRRVNMELKILHTNDIHSNYENFSKIVNKINKIKDENTIILDAGDFADFKRIELQGTGGFAALELLEHSGCDAIAVGNNETFNGLETLINMAVNSKVPFVSCNLYKIDGQSIEGIKRSVIVKKNGFRTLIVGASPDLGEFNTLAGIKAIDYIRAIKEEILLQKDKYDMIIVLSHLGMNRDRKIAEEIKEVDIIIGGHFHILMDKPEIENGKVIHTSGCYGEHLGVLKVKIDDGRVELLESENFDIAQECCSIEIINILRENKEKAITNLSKPLYNMQVNLWHDVVEENPITNLLADALVDLLKCDIGIINSGIINGGIRKGAVSNKKLLELCPSPLNPTAFEIQGKYIREALQDSLDSDICYMDGKGPGYRGRYLGRLHVSNILIEYDGRKINSIFVKGEKLEDDKWYTVASSDYIQRGTGYTSMQNNRSVRYNAEYIRDMLREYAAKRDFVENAFIDRWILK
jgi:5'-nucleotidase